MNWKPHTPARTEFFPLLKNNQNGHQMNRPSLAAPSVPAILNSFEFSKLISIFEMALTLAVTGFQGFLIDLNNQHQIKQRKEPPIDRNCLISVVKFWSARSWVEEYFSFLNV